MATDRAILPESDPQAAIEAATAGDHPGSEGGLDVVRIDIGTRTAIFRPRGPDGVPCGPETATPWSEVQPRSDEDSLKFWTMLVDDLMRILKEERKLPGFVKEHEVTMGDDSAGSPVLYVTILVAPKPRYSLVTIAYWNGFSKRFQKWLLGFRLKRTPYVQIAEKQVS